MVALPPFGQAGAPSERLHHMIAPLTRAGAWRAACTLGKILGLHTEILFESGNGTSVPSRLAHLVPLGGPAAGIWIASQ
jgi:hypothetical protein